MKRPPPARDYAMKNGNFAITEPESFELVWRREQLDVDIFTTEAVYGPRGPLFMDYNAWDGIVLGVAGGNSLNDPNHLVYELRLKKVLQGPVVVAVTPDGSLDIGLGWYDIASAVVNKKPTIPAVVGRLTKVAEKAYAKRYKTDVPKFKQGDYVRCLGEGDTIFRIHDLGPNSAMLFTTHQFTGHWGRPHGWENLSKLRPAKLRKRLTPVTSDSEGSGELCDKIAKLLMDFHNRKVGTKRETLAETYSIQILKEIQAFLDAK